jgi:hypothetical protein
MIYEYYAEVNIDEEIYFNRVTNTADFQINTTNVKGHNKITSFKFKLKSDDEIDINKNSDYSQLNKLTHHYLDFLSSITSYPLTKIFNKTDIFDLNGNRVITINRQSLTPVKSDDVDIDLTLYQNTLFDVSDKNIENFRYYNAGVLFYNSRLYESSIREFFKIIEDDKSIHNYDDYKIIRDLFSHNFDILGGASEKFEKNINLKNKFISKKFTGKNNKEIVIIDKYNSNNILELLRMAKELKEIVESRILN